MEALGAGDFVLSLDAHGELFADRVVINAHIDDESTSTPFLTVHFPHGSLSVTPGHTVWRHGDGLVPAHTLRPGDKLRHAGGVTTIWRIADGVGGVINPVTESGFILASSSAGSLPVRMSVVEEGGWDQLLEQLGLVVPPLLLLTSRAAPMQVQRMEWLLVGKVEDHILPTLEHLPLPIVAALAVLADVLLSTAVVTGAVLGSPSALAAILVAGLAFRTTAKTPQAI
jgi:hypothetical protein